MDVMTARARLRSMVAADLEPTLDATQIEELLNLGRRPDRAGNPPTNTVDASAWSSTTITVDTVIYEAGRWWRCVIPGTTGTTEPTWPDLTGTLVGTTTVIDGDVVWADNGGQWRPTWNLDAAAGEGWDWKAAKAASDFDFGTDGQRFDRSQVIAHCRQMAASARRRGAARSVPVEVG